MIPVNQQRDISWRTRQLAGGSGFQRAVELTIMNRVNKAATFQLGRFA